MREVVVLFPVDGIELLLDAELLVELGEVEVALRLLLRGGGVADFDFHRRGERCSIREVNWLVVELWWFARFDLLLLLFFLAFFLHSHNNEFP